MMLIRNLLAVALLIEGVSGQCSLCEGGSSQIGNRDAVLHAESCGQIENRMAATSPMICDITRDATNFFWDHSAYCCSDAVPSFACSLCEPGFVVAPSDTMKTLPSNAVADNCGEAYVHSVYAESTSACDMIKRFGESTCCSPAVSTRPPTPSPTPSPTNKPEPIVEPTDSTISDVELDEEEGSANVVNPINEQQQQPEDSAAAGISFLVASIGVVAISWFMQA